MSLVPIVIEQTSRGERSMEPNDNPDYNPAVEVMKPLSTWSDGRLMGHRSSMMYDRMIV
jgi:hypothetical protein